MELFKHNYREAKEFFLRGTSYSNLDLPRYFDFTSLIKQVHNLVASSKKNSYVIGDAKSGNLNISLMHNKDGQFDWRRFELIHPVSYAELVEILTSEDNWQKLGEKFTDWSSLRRVTCTSHVQFSEKPKHESIQTWWNEHEKNALKMSMTYRVMGETDISDCYGTLYTHAIPWALHGIAESKTDKHNQKLVGNQIDKALRGMHDQESVGIPQGSVIMDFIAEIVLRFIDSEVEKELTSQWPDLDYKITRHRDDYRIFGKSSHEVELIIKTISTQAAVAGFRLNSSKTKITDDIIGAVIRRDKRRAIPVSKKNPVLTEFIKVHEFSQMFPNSSTLVRRLTELARVLDKKKSGKSIPVEEAIAVTIEIGIKNPRIFASSIGVISRLLPFMTSEDQLRTIENIKVKVNSLPNNGFVLIWLQRLLLKYEIELPATTVLTDKIAKPKSKLWDDSWISNKALKNTLHKVDVIDRVELEKTKAKLPIEEFNIFFNDFSR